jgi:DNA polymerase-1
VCGKGKGQITFDQAPIDKATDYAAEDAEVTLRLVGGAQAALLKERMLGVYETLERPLVPVIAEMEGHGIRVDAARLRELSADFGQRMAALEEQAYQLAGRRFAIGSPKQLGEVLFDQMAMRSSGPSSGGAGRKTKTGAYATDAAVLEELALQGHELPRVVLGWRQLQKLTRTYTESLLEQLDPATSRVHTHYMLTSTSTGRLSSTDPNLRTSRSAPRRAARSARPSCRSRATRSCRPTTRRSSCASSRTSPTSAPLKEAFANDIDIHAVTASQMFGVPVAEVKGDLRRSAKTINYGIVYGIGAFGLAQRLGIPQAVARDYIELYFRQYPGIRDYMERTKVEAREHGFVRTLDGRRCYVPDINNKLPTRRRPPSGRRSTRRSRARPPTS